MKKSILFIIISIFTAVTFLSTAAVCNLCSGLSTIADNIENSQLLQSQASSSNTASGKTPEEEDSSGQGDNTQQNQDQQQDEHHEAPEISIFYDEEPIYSEQDDTWRYIIVSEVYGNPFPKVTWNRDDSNGEHGEYAVQINLKRDEVFKVIATAQNYLEAKTSEITLKYGSPVQQQIEPPDDGRENQQVDQGEQINTEQGDSKEPALLIGGLQSFDHRSIALEGNNCIGGKEDRLVVGDIETVLDKTPHFRSFLRFNIMNISERYSGVTVKDSTLLVDTTVYPPVSGFGDFCIGVVDNQWYTHRWDLGQLRAPAMLFWKLPRKSPGIQTSRAEGLM